MDLMKQANNVNYESNKEDYRKKIKSELIKALIYATIIFSCAILSYHLISFLIHKSN